MGCGSIAVPIQFVPGQNQAHTLNDAHEGTECFE
jgi:hypothetical protein